MSNGQASADAYEVTMAALKMPRHFASRGPSGSSLTFESALNGVLADAEDERDRHKVAMTVKR